MRVNKESLISFMEVVVILRNDKEFIFKPHKVTMEDGIVFKSCFSTRRELVGNKYIDFIEIIRVKYDTDLESAKLKASKYETIASFYRNDVKHYAVI